MQEDNDKSTVRGIHNVLQWDRWLTLRRWRDHSSSMYRHPSALNPKTCKSSRVRGLYSKFGKPSWGLCTFSRMQTCIPLHREDVGLVDWLHGFFTTKSSLNQTVWSISKILKNPRHWQNKINLTHPNSTWKLTKPKCNSANLTERQPVSRARVFRIS